MTTLMQQIIDDDCYYDPDIGNEKVIAFARMITMRRLNPTLAQHPGWLKALRASRPQIAERYVFDGVDPMKVIDDAVSTKQLTFPIVYKQARMPVDIAWMEWKISDTITEDGTPCHVGVMIDTTLDIAPHRTGGFKTHGMMTLYFAEKDRPAKLVMVMFITENIGSPTLGYTVPYQMKAYDGETEDDRQNLAALFMRDIMSLLFLITTPRTTEIVRQEWSSKLQKARRRRGKSPLLEYRKVTLVVGSPRRIIVGDQHTGPSGPRRLHQVVGHWRKYLQGRNEPHITWVPQHWRGDAKLGIVVHDRSVVIPGAPDGP
jgi:hypothetical protein